jgi:hypothetical protein
MLFPLVRDSDRMTPRWLAWAEPLAVFGLIMAYIWWLRYDHSDSWMLIFGFIIASHVWHNEKPATLGFRPLNFRQCLRDLFPVLLFTAMTLLSAGIILQTTREITFDQALLVFAGYCPWGLFQQYLLNAYFANRLAVICSPRYAGLYAALMFAGAHLPNWFLMLVTFAAGYICIRVYFKYRNMWFLGLAHATIGFMLFLVVPDSISHHLNVGPSWFR